MNVVEAGFPGGLRLHTHKREANERTSRLVPLPEQIVLPLQQHIGLPAEPRVAVGETVLKGQVIADSGHYVSVPLHASTSGKVIDIGLRPTAGGPVECIVIEPDGRDAWSDIQPTEDYGERDPQVMHKLIRACGIVGLGGAGFPTHVKVQEGVENEVHTLIINGVECEPYITCDDRLIREKASYVVAGTRMLAHALKAGRSIIAVEEDMPEAAAALKQVMDGDDIELIGVAARYPAGGEKQLVHALTGREVPSGGLAIHIGVVVQNVATAAAVYRAVTRGEPLVSRYVTVTGAVREPGNLQVLLGSPVSDCLKLCGYEGGGSIVLGGPMMGRLLVEPVAPVTKTVNCILVGAEPTAAAEFEQPCIRCGNCVDACPVRLMPHELHHAARASDLETLRDLHLFDCIECGCCAYVCPSHIPLVRDYRNAKAAIAEQERRRAGADKARSRFEARNARLRKEQRQRTPVNAPADAADRLQYIKDAAQRHKHGRGEPPQGE